MQGGGQRLCLFLAGHYEAFLQEGRTCSERMSELALCCPRGLGATLWLGGKPETASRAQERTVAGRVLLAVCPPPSCCRGGCEIRLSHTCLPSLNLNKTALGRHPCLDHLFQCCLRHNSQLPVSGAGRLRSLCSFGA